MFVFVFTYLLPGTILQKNFLSNSIKEYKNILSKIRENIDMSLLDFLVGCVSFFFEQYRNNTPLSHELPGLGLNRDIYL